MEIKEEPICQNDLTKNVEVNNCQANEVIETVKSERGCTLDVKCVTDLDKEIFMNNYETEQEDSNIKFEDESGSESFHTSNENYHLILIKEEQIGTEDNNISCSMSQKKSQEYADVIERTSDADRSGVSRHENDIKVKFESLQAMEQAETLDMDKQAETLDVDSHVSDRNVGDNEDTMQTMMITPELICLIPSSSGQSDLSSDGGKGTMGRKTWTQEDLELALDALRNHYMSLTKASATYGIPSTTLWQRAHRMGIDTPKKEGSAKSWTEENLSYALEELRSGTISANKASKAYGIPSSTLYKIAKQEGIRLGPSFSAALTTWSPEDLERALEAIRSGQTSVRGASTEYGIPTGTLYGRCRREGIEMSRNIPTPWSEDTMGEALEAVRVGQMSIRNAAIHYNLPYSSLYCRLKTRKYEADGHHPDKMTGSPLPHLHHK